jgi:PEGA domain
MKPSLLLAVSLALSVAPQLATAQQAPPAPPSSVPAQSNGDAGDPVRRAQGHFQRGVQLYEEQNYDGALAEFSRAHEIVPNYRILYNLAQTQVERHDDVEAVRLFGEYLEQGGNDIAAARRLATARERDALLERIASVKIESNVDGAELWVDGRSRGVVPSSQALRLNSGHRELRLQKPGFEPVTRWLTLAGGDALVVDMKLERTESSALAPALTLARGNAEPASAGSSNAGLWVSAGATALFAGATATFAILTANENRDLDRELDRFQADTINLDETRSRVRTFAALTDGFAVATALGFGSLLYFIIRDSGGSERGRSSPGEARQATPIRVLVGSSSVTLSKSF